MSRTIMKPAGVGKSETPVSELAAQSGLASKFPAIVHVYTDVLRVLVNAPTPMTATQLATAAGRDKSNVRRDLRKLEEAGVVTLGGEGAVITDEGLAWVRGQAIAEGLASPGEIIRVADRRLIQAAAGHANFRPNPDQPRKDFDDAVIRGIADTMAADAEGGGKGILQPLLVRPRDPHDPLDGDEANPVRMIWAGEQRWRAIGLLIGEDRLPAALDPSRGGGIPFEERPEPPGGASFLALVENGARSDLDPLDEAFAFLDYVTRENLSARQAAIATGRAAKGEGGVRTVQIRIKVAREATAEAIADYRRTRDWNALVDTVQQAGETHEERRAREIRKGVSGLTGRRRLALIELAHKAIMEPADDGDGRTAAINYDFSDPTGAITALVQHAGGAFGGGLGRISDVAQAWLIEERLLDIGAPTRSLVAAWLAHGLLDATIETRLAASPLIWSTEWLNLAPVVQPEPGDAPLFDPPAQVKRLSDILPGRSVITLAEILHLSPRVDGEPYVPQARAGKYWLDANLGVMKDAGLIVIVHEPARPPFIRITQAGLKAFHDAVTERTGGELEVDAEIDEQTLTFIRASWGQAGWPGPGMVTEWLNIEPAAAPAATVTETVIHDVGPARDAAAPPNHEDLGDDEASDAAARVRIDVDRAMASLPVTGFARLMDAAGLGGALRTRPDVPGVVFDAQGQEVLVIDQHGQLPDDLVHARATLVCAALNAANGAGVPLTLGGLAPDEDQSPAARLERALRRVSRWMVWNYGSLTKTPDAEEIYGQVSEALNAAQAARRTEAA